MLNNKKVWEYVKDIYPFQLNAEKTYQSDNLASYLDLTFAIEKVGKRSTKLYDKSDDFDCTLSIFHSCQVIYHLALLMVFTSRSSLKSVSKVLLPTLLHDQLIQTGYQEI